MLYTECIAQVNEWFWKTPEAELIRSKRLCKRLAESLGARVPRTYQVPAPCVWKPDNAHSGRGVVIVRNASDYVLEELIVDEDGSVPPRDFKLFVFGNSVKMIQVSERRDDFNRIKDGWYSHPGWRELQIMTGREWLSANPPSSLGQMVDLAVRIANRFPLPTRVDFYATADGPVFSELCVTPGMALKHSRRITDAGDRLLGRWWEDSQEPLSVDTQQPEKRSEPFEALPACEWRVNTSERDLFHCRHTGVRTPENLVTCAICTACEMRETPCPAPQAAHGVPSLARRGWSFAHSVKEFITDGCRTVCQEEHQSRMAICEACDRRRGNRCMECGCNLSWKARGRAFQCPLGKWPAANDQSNRME